MNKVIVLYALVFFPANEFRASVVTIIARRCSSLIYAVEAQHTCNVNWRVKEGFD